MNTVALKPNELKPKKEHSSRFFSSVGDSTFKVYFVTVLLAFCMLFAWILIVGGGKD